MTVGRQLAAAGNLHARHKLMDKTMRDLDTEMQDIVPVCVCVCVCVHHYCISAALQFWS